MKTTISLRTYWANAYRMARCLKSHPVITPSALALGYTTQTRSAVNLTAADGTTYAQARLVNRALRIARKGRAS